MPFSPRGRALPIAFGWCAAAAWTLAWSETGQAQPDDAVDLRWSAPAACPRGEDVQARMRPLLPERPAAPAPARPALVAEGTIAMAKGRYRLTLNVRYGGALAPVTRVFESEDCASLAGAAAVTLALDARQAQRAEESAPATASTAPAPSPSAPSLPTAPPAVPPPPATASPPVVDAGRTRKEEPRGAPRGWGLVLDVPVLALDEGALPSSAYGVGVGLGLRASRFRVTLQGALWLPQTVQTPPFESSYTRRNAALSGCYGWTVGPVDLGPCVTLALEDVSASGTGPNVVSESGHATWLTAGVAGRAGWSPASWASFFIRPGVTLTTSRPTFAIDGAGSLYQVSFVSAGLDVGCEWIF